MDEKQNVADFLREAGITPTPVRILVYRCLSECNMPLSLADIELRLESVDKSSISRSLTTFRKHNLVNCFNDGSGSAKYEICLNDTNQNDLHVHFRCELCDTTLCLNEIRVPEVKLPTGFISKEANFIITGICKDCAIKSGIYNE